MKSLLFTPILMNSHKKYVQIHENVQLKCKHSFIGFYGELNIINKSRFYTISSMPANLLEDNIYLNISFFAYRKQLVKHICSLSSFDYISNHSLMPYLKPQYTHLVL